MPTPDPTPTPGCTCPDCLSPTMTEDEARTKARELYLSDELEIDDDAEVVYCEHDVGAAWVAAWVYVPAPDDSEWLPVEGCYSPEPIECAFLRERSVAGRSNSIPACPVHGPYPDEANATA